MNRLRDPGTGSDAINIKRKHIGKPCNFFIKGEECPYGENCRYLHQETSKIRETLAGYGAGPDGAGFLVDVMSHRRYSSTGSDAIHVVPTNNPPPENRYNAALATQDDYSRVCAVNPGDGGNVAQTWKPKSWKTKICYEWEITGHCPFGAKCHFAHGSSELQRVIGGVIEGESKMRKSVTMDQNQIGQGETETSSAVIQKLNKLNTDPRWGGPGRISRIYADWIDD